MPGMAPESERTGGRATSQPPTDRRFGVSPDYKAAGLKPARYTSEDSKDVALARNYDRVRESYLGAMGKQIDWMRELQKQIIG